MRASERATERERQREREREREREHDKHTERAPSSSWRSFLFFLSCFVDLDGNALERQRPAGQGQDRVHHQHAGKVRFVAVLIAQAEFKVECARLVQHRLRIALWRPAMNGKTT